MKRYSDEWWQGVKDFNNSFPINIFKKDKEMTANELADAIEKGGKDGFFQDEIVAILRQQQAEIESLKLRELTDEEIEQIADDHIDWVYETGFIEFARAILQKASEK